MVFGIIGFVLELLVLIIGNIINRQEPNVGAYVTFLILTVLFLGLSIFGLVSSIGHFKKQDKKALNITNFVFAILGIILCIIVLIINAVALTAIANQ